MKRVLTLKGFKDWLKSREPNEVMAGFLFDCPIYRFLKETTKSTNVHVGVMEYSVSGNWYKHSKWSHEFVCAFDDKVMDYTVVNKSVTVADTLELL